MDEALAAASEPLRACARIAGGEVAAELRAQPGSMHFTAIEVLSDSPDVERCFRDALAQLRFRPPTTATTRVPEFRP